MADEHSPSKFLISKLPFLHLKKQKNWKFTWNAWNTCQLLVQENTFFASFKAFFQ